MPLSTIDATGLNTGTTSYAGLGTDVNGNTNVQTVSGGEYRITDQTNGSSLRMYHSNDTTNITVAKNSSVPTTLNFINQTSGGSLSNTMQLNQNTSTMNSSVFQTSGVHYPSGEAMTEWYNIYHCTNDTVDSAGWIHIRTPIPADANAGVGWIPYMLEVKGYHTYGGEYSGRWGAIVNTTGDGNNSWYGSQIKYNNSNYSPYVYRSTNTYGGYTRMCFAMSKNGCCCNGWLWVRMNINNGFRNSYPWGKIGTTSQTTAAF
jgi:hypothetical protein